MSDDKLVYEWDDTKSRKNLQKHGVGFDIMDGIDWDFGICADIQNYDGEERELWLAPIGEKLFAVVIMMRDDRIRVISLRYANQTEIAQWRKEIQL